MVFNEHKQAAFPCLKNILAVQARYLQLHLNLHWILSMVFNIETDLGIPVGLLFTICSLPIQLNLDYPDLLGLE